MKAQVHCVFSCLITFEESTKMTTGVCLSEERGQGGGLNLHDHPVLRATLLSV